MGAEQMRDPLIVSIRNSILTNNLGENTAHRGKYHLDQDIVYCTERGKKLTYIPQHLVASVLEYYHNTSLAHVGRDKLHQILRNRFY
ncbi:hypothetical protein BpHYR1_035164 [Brachionus plicatilis]|uniref:Uncharacterized protein n=1 Tax=Brachionus plicatilis TaxID=10195 RepID=A0A3M7PLE7_BRAPC|nr:hypothetical protein BpHYR1_035164 [Brachionus plicatilis]